MTSNPVVSAIEKLAERVRRLEAQITYIAPRAFVFIEASQFYVISGGATLQGYKYGYAIAMPSTSDSYIGTHWVTERHVHDTAQWNFWVYYAMATATSGNIRIGAQECHATDGGLIQNGCVGLTSTVAVPGVVDTLDIFRIPMTRTIPSRNLLTIRIDRPALSDALDTASGDMMFLGLEIATI